MRIQVLALTLGCGLLGASGVAFADDTTTTTTTRTTNTQPAPGVTVGIPGVAGVTIGGGQATTGCATHNVTHTDNDTGESVSRTTTDCN